MHPLGAGAIRIVDYAYAFEEQTEVIERDTPIDMRERPLDYLLELRRAQSARAL
ncbi:MAG TPA: hypothetical protein VE620_13065 [Myxococcales bacterium]|jgi:hypothetical protein|nr:hypothetical protein [Myxococcales bacterium]